jgi:hypothetical protein
MSVFTFTQEFHDFTFPASATTISATGTVADGALLVVEVWQNSTSPALSSVTDGVNTYHAVSSSPQAGGYGRAFLYWTINSGAGSRTVTATFASAAGFPLIQVMEFANPSASPLDDNAANNGGTNQQAVIASKPHELVIMTAIPQSGQTVSPGAGFLQAAANYGMIYAIESGAGTYTPMATSGAGCGVIAATFKSTSSNTVAPTMILLT